MGNSLCRLIRFTDTSFADGDTILISGRLVTFDIFRYFGSKLESEFEWRTIPVATYNIVFIKKIWFINYY